MLFFLYISRNNLKTKCSYYIRRMPEPTNAELMNEVIENELIIQEYDAEIARVDDEITIRDEILRLQDAEIARLLRLLIEPPRSRQRPSQ
jgi:hypothetical protein